MENENTQELTKIYLNDGDIVSWDCWNDRNVELGIYQKVFKSSTNIIEFLGVDTVGFKIKEYLVHASAVKYLADIARIKRKERKSENPAKREILFDGGIQIYQKGQIPGTEIYGMYLLHAGNIWIAEEPRPELKNRDGLLEIIFDRSGSGSLDDWNARIDAIVRGFKTQEADQAKIETKAALHDIRSSLP